MRTAIPRLWLGGSLHPTDAPRGHAPGKNAHRILVLGSGAHEDLTAATALTTTEGRDLWKYDGIVVALGVIDSIMLTSPTISILWAALILREQLTWQTIIGGIAVIFCAGIAVRTRLNRTPPPRSIQQPKDCAACTHRTISN
ncbi:hypothetical protein [Cryobacterium sp. TMT3-29-2]|uniref:hypothetical protein n=1 Tax=Cryobacterium sp. TMT3-29-2 TaxID=2555867 RepID=UPI001073F0BA|nr:hypothetical protein E3O67_07000 [Cryobacterium sp. TMT3-29-2]